MEYQETMNLDIDNISSTNQQIWIPIYEVIHDGYFKVVKLFPKEFWGQLKKKWTSEYIKWIQSSFKNNGFGKWVVCTSGYDPPKEVRW